MTANISSKRSSGLAWKALATIRLVNGFIALLGPRWLVTRLGVDPNSQPAMTYALRMFGIRTVLIGADLWLKPETRGRALRQAILIHASDTTTSVLCAVTGDLPLRSALMAAAISSVNTALAISASKHYGRSSQTEGQA